MIVISRERLKFLLAGRELDVVLDRMPARPYKRGRVYAVGLTHRKTTCHAEILSVTDSPDFVALRLRIAPAASDRPRMLARKSGYTELSDPLDAGEALSVADLEQYARENGTRFIEDREAERGAMPLADRLKDLERRAAAGDQQAKRHLFVIRQRVEAAEKRRAA